MTSTSKPTGDDVLKVTKAMGVTGNLIKALAMHRDAEEIVRLGYLTKGNGTQATISVASDLAMRIALALPYPDASVQAVFQLMSRHGGKVPLHSFASALILNGLTRS